MAKIIKALEVNDAGLPILGSTLVEVELCDAIENIVNQGYMTDDEGLFMQRQLEYIGAKSFDHLYPDLKGRAIFDLNTEGGEGVTSLTYRAYDKRGETAIIAGKATDLPRADISGEEFSIQVRTLANAFGYSRQELASANMVGMPLDARKAEAARRSYEERANQIIWFGDSDTKLHGFFSGPVGSPALTVTKTKVSAGAGGANTTWRGGDKTPDDVIADLTNACANLYASTKQIHRPNMIILSVADKQFLMNTPRSLQSDKSIATWFVENNIFITSLDQIVDVNEVEGIYDSAGGAFDPKGKKGAGFTVLENTGEVVRVREPFPYMHLPVQLKGLEFEINCYGRFAGLEMIRPSAIQHYYGI